MIKPLLLSALMSCPVAKIKNLTPTWTKDDQQVFDSAKVRCGKIFPDAPCLKLFIKKEDQLYNAVCAASTKR